MRPRVQSVNDPDRTHSDPYRKNAIVNPLMGSRPHWEVFDRAGWDKELDRRNDEAPQSVSAKAAKQYLPLEHIDPASLIHTQDWLHADPSLVSPRDRSAKSSEVIIYRNQKGEDFIANGHHRVVAAVRRGDQTIPVRVYSTDNRVPRRR